MGIPGLLDHLKSVITRNHVSDFKGKSVAVDAHCWLHRGAFACSKELVLGNPTEKYISFFMSMISMLKRNGVVAIVVVFDGLPLPNKLETNKRRSEDRKKNIVLAQMAEANGDEKLAMTYYQRSISVTFEMIRKLLVVLSREGVSYMISPYESDAQLAFLSKTGFIDLIITEDSDSIPYGCAAVFFKMDKEGYGDYFEQSKLHTHQTLSFNNWTEDQFILFCCLSGCDYMPKLRDYGIKTAYKVVNKYKTLSKVLDYLVLSNSAADYAGALEVRLEQALMTFKHQTIYNPETRQTEPLTPLPLHLTYLSREVVPSAATNGVRGSVQRSGLTSSLIASEEQLAFLGPLLDTQTATRLMRGEIDPRTIQTQAVDSMTEPTLSTLPTTLSTTLPRTPVSSAAPLDQGPSIRWLSSEDRALRTSHSQRHAITSTTHSTTNPPSYTTSNNYTNNNQTNHTANHITNTTTSATTNTKSNSVSNTSRKRQRTTHAQGQAGLFSQAAALHATSAYNSDLISSALLPLHRRTRLRSVEPVYGAVSSGTVTSVYGGGVGNSDESQHNSSGTWNSPVRADNQFTHYNLPNTHTTANTTTNTTSITTARKSFFDDVTVSPFHTPTTTTLPTTPTYDTTLSATYPTAYSTLPTDTEYTYPTYTTDYTDNEHCADIGTDSMDSYTDDDKGVTGLPQFQDALFEARMAHKFDLHPEGSVHIGGSVSIGGVVGGPVHSGDRVVCDADMYSVPRIDSGVHASHPSAYSSYMIPRRTTPLVASARGLWPPDDACEDTSYPTTTPYHIHPVHNSASAVCPYTNYSNHTYADSSRPCTTHYHSDYPIMPAHSTLPPRTASSVRSVPYYTHDTHYNHHTVPDYTTCYTYASDVSSGASTVLGRWRDQDRQWKRALFPRLQY